MFPGGYRARGQAAAWLCGVRQRMLRVWFWTLQQATYSSSCHCDARGAGSNCTTATAAAGAVAAFQNCRQQCAGAGATFSSSNSFQWQCAIARSRPRSIWSLWLGCGWHRAGCIMRRWLGVLCCLARNARGWVGTLAWGASGVGRTPSKRHACALHVARSASLFAFVLLVWMTCGQVMPHGCLVHLPASRACWLLTVLTLCPCYAAATAAVCRSTTVRSRCLPTRQQQLRRRQQRRLQRLRRRQRLVRGVGPGWTAAAGAVDIQPVM